MWRWRRNPLRRRSDVVEAWAGLATVVVAGVGAPVAGLVAGHTVDTTLRHTVAAQRAERHPVTATVVRNDRHTRRPTDPETTDDSQTLSRTAVVRWRGTDGRTHRARVSIVGRHAPGATFRVWTDGRNRLVEPPLDVTTATTNAVAAGLGAAATVTALLLTARRLLAWRILQRRLVDWGREWARVSGDWGRAGAEG